MPRARARLTEKSTEEKTEYNLLQAGESGDDSITLIPFQVRDFAFSCFAIFCWNVLLLG